MWCAGLRQLPRGQSRDDDQQSRVPLQRVLHIVSLLLRRPGDISLSMSRSSNISNGKTQPCPQFFTSMHKAVYYKAVLRKAFRLLPDRRRHPGRGPCCALLACFVGNMGCMLYFAVVWTTSHRTYRHRGNAAKNLRKEGEMGG